MVTNTRQTCRARLCSKSYHIGFYIRAQTGRPCRDRRDGSWCRSSVSIRSKKWSSHTRSYPGGRPCRAQCANLFIYRRSTNHRFRRRLIKRRSSLTRYINYGSVYCRTRPRPYPERSHCRRCPSRPYGRYRSLSGMAWTPQSLPYRSESQSIESGSVESPVWTAGRRLF